MTATANPTVLNALAQLMSKMVIAFATGALSKKCGKKTLPAIQRRKCLVEVDNVFGSLGSVFELLKFIVYTSYQYPNQKPPLYLVEVIPPRAPTLESFPRNIPNLFKRTKTISPR